MSPAEILRNMRRAGMFTEPDALERIFAAHEKEKSAAIACLRQMDKVNAENARLRKELAKVTP